MRCRRRASIILAASVFSAVAACGSDGEASDGSRTEQNDTFDIAGVVVVNAVSNGRAGDSCRPDEGSAEWPVRPGAVKSGLDIGADVTISDASGEVIGLGTVEVGTYLGSGQDVSSYCEVPFAVKDVPDGDKFYSVAVATIPVERYTRAELDQPVQIRVR